MISQSVDEAGFLRNGNEHIGSNEPQIAAFPTRQRFKPDNAIAVESDQGLVVRHNAIGCDCKPELLLDLDLPLDMDVHLGSKN